ncbi:hypothetical protein MRS44_016229 [Fusarium solani]|uniref:uncharacterized protein n=1 Tax=Fusarium solani TaxID=169388 RepID=UPI0032C3F9FA|nr:hypothetical protein MRS44_016229 [Fusarium solani]
MYSSHNGPTSGIEVSQHARPELNAIEVDTYQIAVPNGDCSVHLLVQRTDILQGKILRSILMDGGNDGSASASHAADIIEVSLKMIWARYDPAGPQEIKFDAWVVTHWDNDHWAGSLKMFQRNMDGNGRSNRMKYLGNTPLSHLYCPNWVSVPKYPAVPDPPKADLLKKRPNDLFIKDDDKSNFNEEEGTGQVYFRNHIQDGYPLCIAKWGHRQLLGMDFFTGNFLWHYLNQPMDKSADNARHDLLSTVNKMKSVVKVSNFQGAKYPRFVCIGVGGFVCGAKVDEAALRVALARKKITPADTWANMSSIISVLFFPEAAHLSLYWGGDSITPIESPLAKSPFFDGQKCSVAKWSHHGGKHSNPEELWQKLEPNNCVVSPNRTGQYLHPNPETIRRFRNYAQTQEKTPKIYSTFYPGWILRKEGQDQLQKDWHEVSPLLPESLACPTYVYNPQTRGHDFYENGYKPPKKQGRPPTKRSTWQIQFIHILSTAEETSDGRIRPFAVAYKSATAPSTTVDPKNKSTNPTFIPPNMTTSQMVDDDNGLPTDAYDAVLSDHLEDEQWQHEFQQSQRQQQGQQRPAYPQGHGYGQSQPNHNQQGNSSQYFNQSYNQPPRYNYQPNYGQNSNQNSNQNYNQSYNQSNSYQPGYGQNPGQNPGQNYYQNNK